MPIVNMFYDKSTFFSGEVTTCIMDTGTSLIALPNREFSVLSRKWMNDYFGVQCSSQICYAEGSCNYLAPKLKPLKFKFDEKKYFTLPPAEYLIRGEDMGVPGYCVFGI